ncbi:hypothetical protein [Paradevosia shaoguanensis]|uniref:hypothetical protein n=1 Tax=Paradevosia shaoguanensis TaxID=1335043 RepID=UPI00193383D5|nr:hypothetical protein [Paradevosia shaoguanensis]
MTSLPVNAISSPIPRDDKLLGSTLGARLSQSPEPGSAVEVGPIVIALDEFRVPVPGSRFRMTVQLAVNEASQAVIAFVLANGQPDGHHMADLIAKAARKVRRSEPNAVLALSVDRGRAFWEAAKVYPIMRFASVRYRSPSERVSRRLESILAGLTANHRGAGLHVESSLELDRIVRTAIRTYHLCLANPPAGGTDFPPKPAAR